jgi:nitroreductase
MFRRRPLDAIEAILTRRSIRKYTDQKISPGLVEELLKAAMSAPSANNSQPWHFVLINERQILDRVPQFHAYSSMLYFAPLAIAVCGDSSVSPSYWVQDCSAATQNILLATHARGLGAVWLGIYPIEQRVQLLSKLLGLPENIVPLCLISLGYPAAGKPSENRYDSTRIHHNHWELRPTLKGK